MQHTYDSAFMAYAAESSATAARLVTQRLQPLLTFDSVLDIGCAYCTWLKHWHDQGVATVFGVDGEYVDQSRIEVDPACFKASDLSKALNLGRRYDLVMSLEVGEHIPPQCATTFADTIASHAARCILFSAAPPGQGGEYHVNEQPYEYWRRQFARHGFDAYDCVRPIIADTPSISYWYRYNTFLYVRREFADRLPEELKSTFVPSGTRLADISPISFKVRKAIVRQLPSSLQNSIARLKSAVMPTGRF
jgi:SAM-dependent methyltransferase